MSKTIEFKDLGRELRRDMLLFAQEVCKEASTAMIDNAPSESGALKDSIRAGINETIGGYNPQPPDTNGEAAKRYNDIKAEGMKLGDKYELRASTPYAVYVEEGTDKQAPNGFVARTLESLDAIADRAAQKAKERN